MQTLNDKMAGDITTQHSVVYQNISENRSFHQVNESLGNVNIDSDAAISMLGCNAVWQHPHHFLFQLANGVLLVGLSSPSGQHGVLFLHTSFVLGFLLLSVWSWVILCAPDYFSWNFSFMIINAIQTFVMLYNIRPVKFCDELEDVYVSVFQPLRVSRNLFKKLIAPDYCTIATLHEGETYASQGVSKTDRLGLVITGRMIVYNSHNESNKNYIRELHQIHAKEFIDSPEFESGISGDEKYKVSIIAASVCRYIFWQKSSLEYLLIKEPYLANIMSTILGRDITNKLYAISQKTIANDGFRIDIRLPCISSAITMNSKLDRDTDKIITDELKDTWGDNKVTENPFDFEKNKLPLLQYSPESQPQSRYVSLPTYTVGDSDDEGTVEDSEKTELLNGQINSDGFQAIRLSSHASFQSS